MVSERGWSADRTGTSHSLQSSLLIMLFVWRQCSHRGLKRLTSGESQGKAHSQTDYDRITQVPQTNAKKAEKLGKSSLEGGQECCWQYTRRQLCLPRLVAQQVESGHATAVSGAVSTRVRTCLGNARQLAALWPLARRRHWRHTFAWPQSLSSHSFLTAHFDDASFTYTESSWWSSSELTKLSLLACLFNLFTTIDKLQVALSVPFNCAHISSGSWFTLLSEIAHPSFGSNSGAILDF